MMGGKSPNYGKASNKLHCNTIPCLLRQAGFGRLEVNVLLSNGRKGIFGLGVRRWFALFVGESSDSTS